MPAAEPKRRWFHLPPDRFVVGLLLAICLLWLSQRFQWFGFNHHKGWTVLIAVAVIGVTAIVMLLWWAAGLIFGCRFQFGLRSLLAFCLAASIAACWLAAEIRSARRQQVAVEWLNNADGWIVYYDWQFDQNSTTLSVLYKSAPPRSSWLLNVLGIDFLSAVTRVDFDDLHSQKRVTDDGIKHLENLPLLRRLDLDATGVTDDSLEHLEGLTELRELDLNFTSATDAGLKHLVGMAHLARLHLAKTRVTEAGVKKLEQALPNCTINH